MPLNLETNEIVTRLLSEGLILPWMKSLQDVMKLLRLKRYYEQIDAVFDEIAINDQ